MVDNDEKNLQKVHLDEIRKLENIIKVHQKYITKLEKEETSAP